MIIKPQAKQEAFLANPADIVIYGGAAGGGKTWSLLYEALRHVDNPGFEAVIFRKNSNQITNPGGLWDASFELYGHYPGARAIKSPAPYWKFPSGAKVSFRHLERDENVYKWQGAEICLIEWDELTHFSEKMFFYMLSRNRSICGVNPYVRASCNPDADSWVANFLAWWIDPDTGYAIEERSGKIRYMARVNEEILWGDSAEAVVAAANAADYDVTITADDVKSVAFVASNIYDNAVLLSTNKGYLSNLKALTIVERERLLYGNWKIKAAKGLYFPRAALPELLDAVPTDVVRWVRGWDLAATDTAEGGDPAYTASVLLGKRKNGRYVIADATNHRLKADKVRQMVKQCAALDKATYKRVRIRLSQDPGQAGKEQAESYIKMLAGYNVVTVKESGDKESRAEPFAAQWQAGNVDVVAGPWTETLLAQYEAFPESKFKDLVDSGANAFNELEKMHIASAPPDAVANGDANAKTSYWFK
ncbi:MAG: phage terminase large subunit [Peptococcaceae bacterium]|nr:phage terminase large subunit [Peptococcaceae bacterium]